MKNLFLNPNLLYLVNTSKIEYSGLIECPKVQIYPKRENIAVLEASNHFYELEKIKSGGLFLGKELPIRESSRKFIDITTTAFRKFSYGKDFDFKNANLKTLRSEYRKYRIMELEDASVFGIQKLYRGRVFMKDTSHPRDPLISEMIELISEIHTFFIQLENGRLMLLVDFLEGKHLDSKVPFLNGKDPYLKVELEEEIPLKEIKDISIPYLKSQKKNLSSGKI